MKKVRVAGVGAGYFAQFHLAGWKAIPEVEYVALCDADEAKARAYAERFGIPRVFRDAGLPVPTLVAALPRFATTCLVWAFVDGATGADLIDGGHASICPPYECDSC